MGLDIFFGIILVAFIIWGLSRGIVRNIFGLLGVVVGLIVASRFYLNFFISKWHSDYAHLLSFLTLFILVSLLIYLIGHFLYAVMSSIKLGFVDHLLGAILGLITGSMVVWVICFIVLLFPDGNIKIKHSKVSLFVLKEFKWAETYLPQKMQSKLDLEKPREKVNFLDVEYGKTVTAPPERARAATRSIGTRQSTMDSLYKATKF